MEFSQKMFNCHNLIMKLFCNKLVEILLILVFLLYSQNSFAIDQAGGILNNVNIKFYTTMKTWQSVIAASANYVLMATAVIALFISGYRLLMTENTSFMAFVGEFCKIAIAVGFFKYVIENSTEFFKDTIFSGFSNLASKAASFDSNLQPSDIVNSGLKAMKIIMESIDGWTDALSPDGVMKIAIAIFLLVIFCVIAVNALIALIRFFFILYAGLILVGFALTEWTRDWAFSYIKSLIAAAFSYYGTILILNVSMDVFNSCLNDFSLSSGDESWMPLASIFMAALVTCLTTQSLPKELGSLISHIGPGQGLSVGQVVSGAVAGAVSGAMAAKTGAIGLGKAGSLSSSVLRTTGNAVDTGLRRMSGTYGATSDQGKAAAEKFNNLINKFRPRRNNIMQ